jgi:hypothetical protein
VRPCDRARRAAALDSSVLVPAFNRARSLPPVVLVRTRSSANHVNPPPPPLPGRHPHHMAGTATLSEAAAATAKKGKQLTPEELQARRDSALVEAKRAEDEATTAAVDRDTSADRALAALQHASAARAEAALGDPDAPKDDADLKDHASDRVNPDHDLHQAMLLHEATAVVNLHHHAAAVQNIRSPSSSASTPWRITSSRTLRRPTYQIGASWIASSSPGSPAPSPTTWRKPSCLGTPQLAMSGLRSRINSLGTRRLTLFTWTEVLLHFENTLESREYS